VSVDGELDFVLERVKGAVQGGGGLLEASASLFAAELIEDNGSGGCARARGGVRGRERAQHHLSASNLAGDARRSAEIRRAISSC
jgi:hypothetical protein